MVLIRRLGYTCLGGLAAAAFVGGQLSSAGKSPAPNEDDAPRDMLVSTPPIQAPPPSRAATARLSPATRVIGVTVGGRHRAYVLSTMLAVHKHVVNDLLGEAPVTIAYCDRTDCVSAYTAGGPDPLKVAVGGWTESDGMLVRVGKHRYTQRTGRSISPDAPAFPYQVVAAEKTTWAEWRAAHPDTDVCGD